eukprot:6788588-Alexandrium_andersonii.AAC.1
MRNNCIREQWLGRSREEACGCKARERLGARGSVLRPQGPQGSGRQGHPRVVRQVRARRGRGRLSQGCIQGCLLYTSDAADDM